MKEPYDSCTKIDNTSKIHDGNLQKLVTEMYKIKNNLSPSLRNMNICKDHSEDQKHGH